MNGGLILPGLRTTSAGRRELDPMDPINRGRRLLLPLTERGTYAEPSHNTHVWDITPFHRMAGVTNSTAKLVTSRGFAYSSYNHPTQGSGINQFVGTASACGLENKNKSLSVAISIYQTSGTNKGTYFGVGGSGTGYWICTGASDADTNGTNLLVLFQAVRWINTGVAVGTGWHDIILTLDQSGYPTIYLDGKAVYSDTGSLAVAPGAGAVARVGADHAPARYTNGAAYQGASLWDRTLTAAEARRLRVDPWAGTIDPAARLFFAVRSGASGITGTAAITLADATLAATGSLPITGALAATLADATLSATGTLPIVGALAATLAEATLSATGTLPIVGALATTLAEATLDATGEGPAPDPITGELAVTLAGATLAATGQVGADSPALGGDDAPARREDIVRLSRRQRRMEREAEERDARLRATLERAYRAATDGDEPATEAALAEAVEIAPPAIASQIADISVDAGFSQTLEEIAEAISAIQRKKSVVFRDDDDLAAILAVF